MSKEPATGNPTTTSPFTSLADELATMERHALDRMKTAMSEATRLTLDALDYAAALSAHWRSTALDAVRRISVIPAP